jgi:hypothetical protein
MDKGVLLKRGEVQTRFRRNVGGIKGVDRTSPLLDVFFLRRIEWVSEREERIGQALFRS